MFFRRKRSGRTEYLQIVKNERIDGQPRQSVVATLGRVDGLAQDGTLDRLLRSGARFAHNAVVLTAYERAAPRIPSSPERTWTRRSRAVPEAPALARPTASPGRVRRWTRPVR